MQHTMKILIWCILVAPICIWLGAVEGADERYTTQPGDTLWEIAGRYVQDHTITTYQMMLALFETNPNAFIDDDINRLKTGYELRISAQDVFRAFSDPLGTGGEPATDASPEPLVLKTEEAEADTATVVAQDMVKLQRELALTQEQATRQHDENEKLRARVAALEARVIKLDEMASAPVASGPDETVVTPPLSPPSKRVWLTIPKMIAVGALVVLGLAVIWFWGRRTTTSTVVTETTASTPVQLNMELSTTETTDPLALGLSDLDMEVEGADMLHDLSTDRPMASVETGGEVDATLAALMIDLDDLFLEPGQGVENRSEGVSAASITSKAEPSNVC